MIWFLYGYALVGVGWAFGLLFVIREPVRAWKLLHRRDPKDPRDLERGAYPLQAMIEEDPPLIGALLFAVCIVIWPYFLAALLKREKPSDKT